MMPLPTQDLLWGFLYFCRIGAMVMVFPGFSTVRIPVFARLLLAIGLTAALTPLLLDAEGARPAPAEPAPAELLRLVWAELLKGLVLGLAGRLFFLAFEFLATALAQFIGIGNFPGMPAEGQEPVPALVSLIMLTATVLVFATEMHMFALAALMETYQVSPVGEAIDAADSLSDLAGQLSRATFLSLQAIAPFMVYAVVVNLAIGLVNRMTPQIPAYFISLPLVMIGGLFLLFFVLDEMFGVFIAGFADWLVNG